MKLVLLFSTDGFDLDVLENQKSLYKEMGYKVLWGSVLIPCDLIVVLRCNNKDLIGFPERTPLLFLDYSGQDVLSVFRRTVSSIKQCITSQKIEHDGDIVHFGHPYVSIERFALPIENSLYNYVHIGNYKPNKVIPALEMLFEHFCSSVSANIWGKNWLETNLKNINYHGPLRPEKVSSIYSRSRIALGIKHDFQLGKAISGRYWHAPLNGCVLYVEDDYLIDEIPGLYLYNHQSELPSRENVAANAIDYWKKSNEVQKKISADLLANNAGNQIINVAFYFIYGIYSRLYEKYRLYTYVKK